MKRRRKADEKQTNSWGKRRKDEDRKTKENLEDENHSTKKNTTFAFRSTRQLNDGSLEAPARFWGYERKITSATKPAYTTEPRDGLPKAEMEFFTKMKLRDITENTSLMLWCYCLRFATPNVLRFRLLASGMCRFKIEKTMENDA